MVDLGVNVRANKKVQATLQKFQESLVLNLKQKTLNSIQSAAISHENSRQHQTNMLTTAKFIASTVTVMNVMTVGSLGIDMWVCQVKDSTFYNAATQINTKQLQVSYVTLFT